MLGGVRNGEISHVLIFDVTLGTDWQAMLDQVASTTKYMYSLWDGSQPIVSHTYMIKFDSIQHRLQPGTMKGLPKDANDIQYCTVCLKRV